MGLGFAVPAAGLGHPGDVLALQHLDAVELQEVVFVTPGRGLDPVAHGPAGGSVEPLVAVTQGVGEEADVVRGGRGGIGRVTHHVAHHGIAAAQQVAHLHVVIRLAGIEVVKGRLLAQMGRRIVRVMGPHEAEQGGQPRGRSYLPIDVPVEGCEAVGIERAQGADELG